MKLKQKMVRAALALRSVSLSEIKTDKGVLVFAGDTWDNGTEVFFVDENGESVPAGDGVYVEEATGKTFEIKDGKIVIASVEASEDTEAIVNEIIALKTDVDALRAEFEAFKQKVADALQLPSENVETPADAVGANFSKIRTIIKNSQR